MYEPTFIAAEKLADFFGITLRTLADLQKREIVVRAGKQGFDLREATRAYTSHLRNGAAARGAAGPGLTAERERLVREQADREALKNAQARGEMLPAAEVQAAWATILRDLRAGFLALPARIQQRLGHLTAHDVAGIDREIRDCLARLGDDEL
jgi:phage terminase Nu1 subunit (DNA packaging protein)